MNTRREQVDAAIAELAVRQLERAVEQNRRLANALRELLDLCAIGDVDENTEVHGWGAAIRRAKELLTNGVPVTSALEAVKAKLESEPAAGGDAYHPLYSMAQIERAFGVKGPDHG